MANNVQTKPHKSRICHVLSVYDATMVPEQYAITDAISISYDWATMYHGFLCRSA